MRTLEQKLATKDRKAHEHLVQKERAWRHHPANVRYAKAKYKKGTKRQRKNRKPIVVKLGVQ